jgi:hypothetical protein
MFLKVGWSAVDRCVFAPRVVAVAVPAEIIMVEESVIGSREIFI